MGYLARMWELFQEGLPRLIDGTIITIELVVLAGIFGLILAVPLALMRIASNPLLRVPAFAVIFVMRGTPLITQIFLIYYGLAQFDFIHDTVLWDFELNGEQWTFGLWDWVREPWFCAVLAFSINTAAYVAEVLRGGIEGVPYGEVEAARACGMNRATLYRRIILPRAFRISLPALSNEAVILMKSSALASTITILDLMGQTRILVAKSLASIQYFLIAGVIYYVLVLIMDHGFKWAERRYNRYLRRA